MAQRPKAVHDSLTLVGGFDHPTPPSDCGPKKGVDFNDAKRIALFIRGLIEHFFPPLQHQPPFAGRRQALHPGDA